MRARSIAWYEARVVFGASAALAALIPPLMALFQWFIWSQRLEPATEWEITRVFELTTGLAAGLGAAHLMGVERQEGFHELRRTYPESPWRLPLLRTAGAIATLLLPLLLTMLCFRLSYGSYDLGETVLPALAPALFLLGLGLLLGNVTGNYWVAAGGVLGYWFVELITRGEVTGTLFLFNRTYPVDGVSDGLNRALLVGIGVGLLVLNALWAARRPGWREAGRFGKRPVGGAGRVPKGRGHEG
ncbi:MAG: hypothetical protein QJR03_04710 [Sphaerobacter sp.]|nr:hypothetical protein [Sphaerobacter sp.]